MPPENTLAGFRAAKALGCAWVEFDIRLTGDGALAVCHDDRLDRTTDGKGRISKMDFADRLGQEVRRGTLVRCRVCRRASTGA